MNINTLIEAEEEAERFLDKVKNLQQRLSTDKYVFNGCRETGAVKRASLDLSNALADLRNSDKK